MPCKELINLQNVVLEYPKFSYTKPSIKQLFGVNKNYKSIRAIDEVSLSISEGEKVALIGHNGAGKSTFLKMIAGIYPINSGQLTVCGDIRSMFDISLGFEPDATGRENILYRSLLMGISPSEVKSKEREIVEFSELGEFIDLPIRSYSAGMLVRLAFSITTAYRAELLLIDEVIGAGDASFIEKAKNRLLELINESKSLILASHDESMVRKICNRGIVFKNGKVICDDSIDNALYFYSNLTK
ncbi:ABC transporter ATP-binding protein [Pseudoalteromonas sp. MMG024]|uniref:ABC transporter ATP-binding protein n=1 Tax=Pseudoalteromonas sp. MMG024 TaxID=2909980 RepID=UPI001F349457|nr:ABC transporter ATP-binding protein [Pseudoalteromonas sp. MMG024]